MLTGNPKYKMGTQSRNTKYFRKSSRKNDTEIEYQ